MVAQMLAVVRKDLLIEWRGKANLNALIFFAGLVLVILSFALGPSPVRLHAVAAGLLWVAFVFAGVLAFGRAYQTELDNRCFEGSILAGADPKALYLGKLLSTVAIMLLVEAVVVACMSILYNLDIPGHVPVLALIAILGTVGFAAIGTLYGALTMSLRAREVLLPLLLLPVVLPVILATVRATSIVLSTGNQAGMGTWLELLIVFDVMFVVAGLLMFEFAIEG
jgi:heme exporter protein B